MAIYKPDRRVEPGSTETVRSRLEPGITGYYLLYQILDEAGLHKLTFGFREGRILMFKRKEIGLFQINEM